MLIERILKQRINKNGYAQVNLTQRIGRKTTITVTVHKLVALAFLDQPLANPGKTKGCSRIKHMLMDVKLITQFVILNGLK